MYWLNKVQQLLISKNFLLFVLVLFVGNLVYKRIVWDSGISPLIQSDSQIKLYQTIEYRDRGIHSHQCFAKHKDFDENYRFYPFRYPWTVFTTDDFGIKHCVFQYPSFFAQTVSLLPIPYRLFNGIILFLYLILSFFVVLSVRSLFEIKQTNYLALAGLLFLVGYGISSAIEFSESIPAQLLLLSFFFVVFRLENNQYIPLPFQFLFGFFGAVSIFLRSESLMFIGILGLMVLYRNRTKFFVSLVKYMPLIIGFILAFALLGYYNFTEFQEILGVRSKVSFADFSRLDLNHRFHLIQEFFLGNADRIGFIFYCFPILILIIYSCFKLKLSQLQKLIITVTLTSFVTVVILSPYSSGGLYLGLRFTEFSYLLFSIFVISLLSTVSIQKERQIVILLILLQIGLGLYHVRRNFKTIDFVKKYHEIFQAKLNEQPDSPVVHLSVFDLLLISDSFLKKPHWIANKQSEFNTLESKFMKSGVKKFQVFFYDFKPPKDDNVTEGFYEEWIDTKYEIRSNYYQKVSDEEIAGFRLMLWEKK
ncbi:LA_3751/LA_3752 family putative glycosyltransferase [Leptospira kanakyensis]|uniref:LA_3751/LA_3752 family putative glycosyltransferase n=1 Tax=Leptospira kanakyensis TaxID=2484968 RepID=UPI00223E5063|nr:hypothetical protein [Leptospira kanakyensis]MCW7471353.1 hypothetical protein [Leptospira kanakyensis]